MPLHSDVLLEVLKYLPPSDAVRAGLVSQDWHAAASHEILWEGFCADVKLSPGAIDAREYFKRNYFAPDPPRLPQPSRRMPSPSNFLVGTGMVFFTLIITALIWRGIDLMGVILSGMMVGSYLMYYFQAGSKLMGKALRFCSVGYRSRRMIIIGLDNAGKSTMLNMWKNDKLVLQPPTTYPVRAYLKDVPTGTEISVHDFGGHRSARRIWTDYLMDDVFICWMVDQADPCRFQ
eukprot:gene18279-5803_t